MELVTPPFTLQDEEDVDMAEVGQCDSDNKAESGRRSLKKPRLTPPASVSKSVETIAASTFTQPATHSLFSIFSNLKSPRKQSTVDPDIADLLADAQLLLRTAMFSYQFESVARMLGIELCDFDATPLGVESGQVAGRGGILCENMGTGKTLIVIALVAATLDLPASKIAGSWTVELKLDTSQRTDDPVEDVPSFKWNKSHDMPMSLFQSPASRRLPSLLELTLVNLKINCNGKNLPGLLESLPPHILTIYSSIHQTYTVHDVFDYSHGFSQERDRRSNALAMLRESPPIHLSQTTLIAVPDTLMDQWINEFNKHLSDSSRIPRLVLRSKDDVIPSVRALMNYRVILISHSRLAQESESGRLTCFGGVSRHCRCPYIGRTREVDCRCATDVLVPVSPLMQIHFKRLVFDEGHLIKHESALPLSKLLQAVSKLKSDCKWVCSGTPLPNILVGGIEDSQQRVAMEKADLKKLEGLVVQFLRLAPFCYDKLLFHKLLIRPWAESSRDCVQRVTHLFDGIMVRHTQEDIVAENPLPPIFERRVLLTMNKHERININIIISMIKLNSILSEREGRDYFGHPSQKDSLHTVVSNLQLSLFHFNGKDILEQCDLALSSAQQGLTKALQGEKSYDIALLQQIISHLQLGQDATYKLLQSCADDMLYVAESRGCCTWSAVDVGVMVDAKRRLLSWREVDDFRRKVKLAVANLEVKKASGLVPTSTIGIVHDGSHQNDGAVTPTAISSEAIWLPPAHKTELENSEIAKIFRLQPKLSVSASNGHSREPSSPTKRTTVVKKKSTPKPRKVTIVDIASSTPDKQVVGDGKLVKKIASSPRKGSLKALHSPKPNKSEKGSLLESSIRKVSFADDGIQPPSVGKSSSSQSASPSGSDMLQFIAPASDDARVELKEPELPELCGKCDVLPSASLSATAVSTFSTKLSYLGAQILKYHELEKIIVYTTHDNEMVAIREFCNLAKIKCLLFQKTGQTESQKAKNVTTFNTSDLVRVIIMDVTKASFGLDLSTASRIYFIRPVVQSAMYNQAIKRAHRLGCTKPVHVETLVFAGTLENVHDDDEGKTAYSSAKKAVSQSHLQNLKMKDLIDLAPFVEMSLGVDGREIQVGETNAFSIQLS